jgi:ABC-2 type transport system ATP-binding protein
VTAAIRFDGVTKVYRGGGGIFDVDVEVATGEVFGFLGPNGAGKTTTMRLLLDLIRPDAGRIEVLGRDPRSGGRQLRQGVGYLPGDLALWDRLTAREICAHLASLRGLDPRVAEPFATRLELELDRPVRSLSRGNRQKVGVVQAFMGDPPLLVLDEPTSGLDPIVQHEVHQMIAEARREGRTVFLSSHVLAEVSHVADRVGIIRAGRMVQVAGVDELRSQAVHRVEARLGEGPDPHDLARLAGVHELHVDGDVVRFDLVGSVDEVVKALAAYEVVELTVHEPDLEEVFLGYYTEPGA